MGHRGLCHLSDRPNRPAPLQPGFLTAQSADLGPTIRGPIFETGRIVEKGGRAQEGTPCARLVLPVRREGGRLSSEIGDFDEIDKIEGKTRDKDMGRTN